MNWTDLFIYSACLELGLVTFEYDASGNIWPVDTLVPSVFAGLKPRTSGRNPTLCMSLGGYAGLIPQRAGLAVVDVSDPANMSLTAQWDSIAWNQGSAKVIKHGNTVFWVPWNVVSLPLTLVILLIRSG